LLVLEHGAGNGLGGGGSGGGGAGNTGDRQVEQELLIKVLLVELELIPPNMALEAVAVLEQLALMAQPSVGGGGAGVAVSITGSSVTYAGGGGWYSVRNCWLAVQVAEVLVVRTWYCWHS
jgi:hypothetical protein